MKAEATYREDLEKVINENPYQMILDIDGIGFKSVDKIAMNLGIAPDDRRRVKAAILYTLINLCHSTGDTYTFSNAIYSNLLKLIQIEREAFDDYLNELIAERLIINKDEKYFHYRLFDAERNIAKNLKPFINRKINQKILDSHFDKMLEIIQYEEGIEDRNRTAFFP